MAIGCEPGQARKGAAATTDSGVVIRFSVIVILNSKRCALQAQGCLVSKQRVLQFMVICTVRSMRATALADD